MERRRIWEPLRIILSLLFIKPFLCFMLMSSAFISITTTLCGRYYFQGFTDKDTNLGRSVDFSKVM